MFCDIYFLVIFFFFSHKSLIGLCFVSSSYVVSLRSAQGGKKIDLEKFFSGGGVNVVGHRNYYLQL